MSLLSICQDAAVELALEQPVSVIGSSDLNNKSLLQFANKEGRELVKATNWENLTLEQTFTTTAAAIQTGAIPADFQRFANDSMYNRTGRRKVLGPITPAQWQNEQASVTAGGQFDWFRRRGNDILFTPTPPASETIAFEYISTYWVDTDADGLGEAVAFAADADTVLLPEDVLILGVIWRFRKSKGLPWETEFAEYQRQLEQASGRDGGAPTLSLVRGGGILGSPNTPSTGFGV